MHNPLTSQACHRACREVVPLRVLPVERVLHGGFGEGQARDYVPRLVMLHGILQVR